MKIKNILLLWLPHIWLNCFAILLSGLAVAQEIKTLPDWSGVWERYEGNGGMFDISTTQPPEGWAGSPGVRQFPPLTEFWEKKYKQNLELVALDRLPDPISICGTPAGYPRLLALPDVYEFIVREEKTWIITENGPNIMRIYTDGRTLPEINERWSTYTGESVGTWDQEVLVFTTVSMIGEKSTVLDRSGLTLSDQAEISTRLFQNEEGLLRAELSITDPIALTEPWKVTRHFRKLPLGTRIFDYACAENNRNPVTSSGKTLTLGPDGNPIDVNFD
tara:strand:- start:3199 stop:4026 length:828 start_codon:yes stop_codon:yes gene_type:complete